MSNRKETRTFVECQGPWCASPFDQTLSTVRMWNGQPICQECWECMDHGGWHDDGGHTAEWSDLPDVTMEDLEP